MKAKSSAHPLTQPGVVGSKASLSSCPPSLSDPRAGGRGQRGVHSDGLFGLSPEDSQAARQSTGTRAPVSAVCGVQSIKSSASSHRCHQRAIRCQLRQAIFNPVPSTQCRRQAKSSAAAVWTVPARVERLASPGVPTPNHS